MTKRTDSIQWIGDESGLLDLLDQTLLPTTLKRIECQTVETVWEAIKMLRVRGAPAIGIAAAYGVIVGLKTVDDENEAAFFERFDYVLTYLAESRATAVNLFGRLIECDSAVSSKRTPVAVSQKHDRHYLLKRSRSTNKTGRCAIQLGSTASVCLKVYRGC